MPLLGMCGSAKIRQFVSIGTDTVEVFGFRNSGRFKRLSRQVRVERAASTWLHCLTTMLHRHWGAKKKERHTVTHRFLFLIRC